MTLYSRVPPVSAMRLLALYHEHSCPALLYAWMHVSLFMLCHDSRATDSSAAISPTREAACARADAPRVPERAPLGLLTAFDATSAARPATAVAAHSGLDCASAAGGSAGYNGAAARGSAAQGLLRLRNAGGAVASETGSGGAQPAPCSGLSGTAGRHYHLAAGVDVRQGVGHKRSGSDAGLLPSARSQPAQAPRLGATGAAGSSPGSAAAALAAAVAQHPLACGAPRQHSGPSTAQPEHPARHMAAPARPSSGGVAGTRHDPRRQPTPHKVRLAVLNHLCIGL